MTAKRKGKEIGFSPECRSRRRKSCVFVDDSVIEVDEKEDESHHDIQSGKNSSKQHLSNIPVIVKDEEWNTSELGLEDSDNDNAHNAENQVPDLLKFPTIIVEGMWVRMKYGHYKGDLAQVVNVNAIQKRATVKLVPRIDLRGMAEKLFGDGRRRPAENTGVPASRFINSHELELFRRHIKMKHDHETNEFFEILDGLMLKGGYLYKKVSFFSLIYSGVRPLKTELFKFESSEDNKPQDMGWIAYIYQEQNKKNLEDSNIRLKKEKTYQLHDLVMFGEKDVGIIISMEQESFLILKGDVQGSSVVNIQQKDIKKLCDSKFFTASDCHMTTVYINDSVKVTDGLQKDRMGTIKHIYKGILFIYDEDNPENYGYFVANSESCEIKKSTPIGNMSCSQGILGRKEDSELHRQQENRSGRFERFPQSKELPFRVGQTMRIRVGALKGYMCRVVRVHHSGALVRLDSSGKLMKVDADHLMETSTNLYTKDADVSYAIQFGNEGGELFLNGEGIRCQASWDSNSQSSAWNQGSGWQGGGSSSGKDQDENDARTDPWAVGELTPHMNVNPAQDSSWTHVKKPTGHATDSWGKINTGEESQHRGTNESQPVDWEGTYNPGEHQSDVDFPEKSQASGWKGYQDLGKGNESQAAEWGKVDCRRDPGVDLSCDSWKKSSVNLVETGGWMEAKKQVENASDSWAVRSSEEEESLPLETGCRLSEKEKESQSVDFGGDWNKGKDHVVEAETEKSTRQANQGWTCKSKEESQPSKSKWENCNMKDGSQPIDWEGGWNQGKDHGSGVSLVQENQTAGWGGDLNREKISVSYPVDRGSVWNQDKDRGSGFDLPQESQTAGRGGDQIGEKVNKIQSAGWGGCWNQGKECGSVIALPKESQTVVWGGDWNEEKVNESQSAVWGGGWNQGKDHGSGVDLAQESQTSDWGGNLNGEKISKSHSASWEGGWNQGKDRVSGVDLPQESQIAGWVGEQNQKKRNESQSANWQGVWNHGKDRGPGVDLPQESQIAGWVGDQNQKKINESQSANWGGGWNQGKDRVSGVDLPQESQIAGWVGDQNQKKINESQSASWGGGWNQGKDRVSGVDLPQECQIAGWGGDQNQKKINGSQSANWRGVWNQGKDRGPGVDFPQASQTSVLAGGCNQGRVDGCGGSGVGWEASWNPGKDRRSGVDLYQKSQTDGWGGDRNQKKVNGSQNGTWGGNCYRGKVNYHRGNDADFSCEGRKKSSGNPVAADGWLEPVKSRGDASGTEGENSVGRANQGWSWKSNEESQPVKLGHGWNQGKDHGGGTDGEKSTGQTNQGWSSKSNEESQSVDLGGGWDLGKNHGGGADGENSTGQSNQGWSRKSDEESQPTRSGWKNCSRGGNWNQVNDRANFMDAEKSMGHTVSSRTVKSTEEESVPLEISLAGGGWSEKEQSTQLTSPSWTPEPTVEESQPPQSSWVVDRCESQRQPPKSSRTVQHSESPSQPAGLNEE